tara:strand:- start:357 stop:704 length:348 start_codon:yes stop_codon:yes gene_type:complete
MRERKLFKKFKNRDLVRNAEWNIVHSHRFNKRKDLNESIMNRQLNVDLDSSVPIEAFSSVMSAQTAIDEEKQKKDDLNGYSEISERAVNSERTRLYGYTILTILTLTGGIIITTM